MGLLEELIISSIGAATLLGIVLWLGKGLIVTRLKNSVAYEYDAKLAEVHSSLRKHDESFRAELRAKEREIDLLRSGTMASVASRSALLDKRRLEAVDQVWNGALELGKLKGAVAVVSVFNLEALEEGMQTSDAIQAMVLGTTKSIDTKIDLREAQKGRLYVSSMAWALFSAYAAVLGHAGVIVDALRLGLPASKYVDHAAIASLIKSAIPEESEEIDRRSAAGGFYALEILERRLVEELRNVARGDTHDAENMEQIAVILEKSREIQTRVEQRGAEMQGTSRGLP